MRRQDRTGHDNKEATQIGNKYKKGKRSEETRGDADMESRDRNMLMKGSTDMRGNERKG